MEEELLLRVEPEKLQQTAEGINGRVTKLSAAFDSMREAMNRTNGYWIGEAGDAHRRAFLEQQPRREEILARLSEQAADLLQMAGVYVSVEKENVELTQSLRGDVIL